MTATSMVLISIPAFCTGVCWFLIIKRYLVKEHTDCWDL